MQPKKPLYDITPFSTLDYPDHLAAIFWFAGCNMRCDYCYNANIVFSKGSLSADDALTFLKQRTGLLDAVVLSGGEATLFENIIELAQQIKELGFKIKLDTNGTAPKVVETLLKKELIDYIALDYKAPKQKFSTITHNQQFTFFNYTLELLINSETPFEVRTTLHSDLLNECDINSIIEDLYAKGYRNSYYIQNFLYDENTIGKLSTPTKGFDKNRLNSLLHVEFRN
ncbi:MAG: anaerobic ribonucleoside-triphosphate reductase activating protein [Campylobacterota bacterium]|nr:anaerobic ribonucleoside-triphosphate reductase activating protein [Campylobacterota bacterium]